MAEAIGATFGVIVIDQVADKLAADRLAPVHEALMQDAREVHASIVNLFNAMVQYAPDADRARLTPRNWEHLDSALARIDLLQPASRAFLNEDGTIRQASRAEALSADLQRIATGIDRFIQRYATIAEPGLLRAARSMEVMPLLMHSRDVGFLRRARNIPDVVWHDSFPYVDAFAAEYEASRRAYRLDKRGELDLTFFGSWMTSAYPQLNQALG